MRRRWLVVLLALTACRQALGIPGSGSTSGDQVGFRVIAKVAGADGASGGTMVLVNDTVVPLTDGDMIKLEAPLDDGETFTVTSARPNCHCHSTHAQRHLSAALAHDQLYHSERRHTGYHC